MEIARLEVSTQQHLDRMQKTAKVKYVQYGKSTKGKKGKKSTQSGASGGNYKGNKGHGTSSMPGEKGKKLPFLQDTCYRCGKGRHQNTQDCKALDVTCRGCGKKGHFEKVCLKKHSTHSLEVPQASTSSAGAGPGEPLYFGECSSCKQTFNQVPHSIGLYNTEELDRKLHYTPQTMLLKADTGADVNLMKRQTFNQLLGEAKVLQPTPIRMENYGNTAVKVLRMFHVFLRWKDKVTNNYFTLLTVTDPLTCCQRMLVTHLVF